MSVAKTAAGIACGLTMLLLVLAFNIKKPETALYEKTVKILMRQEGLTTEQEIEERFPELNEIQSNMNQMAKLNQIVLRKTQGPSAITSEEENRELESYRQRLWQLRKKVRTELSQTIAIYTEVQP